MWVCSKCKAQAADGTVVCGGCGTNTDGTGDANYAKVKAEAGPYAVPTDEALKIAGLPAIEYLRGLESFLSNFIDGFDKPDWLVNPAYHPHVIAFIQSRANNAAFMGKARSLQDNRARYYAAMKLRASQPPKPRTRKPIPRRPAASAAAVPPAQSASPAAPAPGPARPVAQQAPATRPAPVPAQAPAPVQARPAPPAPRNDAAVRPAAASPPPAPSARPMLQAAPVPRPQPAPAPPAASAPAVPAPAAGAVPLAVPEAPTETLPEPVEAPSSTGLYIGVAVLLVLAAALVAGGVIFFVYQ